MLVIETPRLAVRTLTVVNAAVATQAQGLLLDSDEANREWLSRWCEQPQRQLGFSYWGCWSRDVGELIGFCGWRQHDFGVALGYAVADPFRRRGLATEAARAVVSWGREHLGSDRLFASIRPPNPPSVLVLEHAGMVRALDYHDGQSRRLIYTLPERVNKVQAPVG
jgi:RimJ/RimL family protein N-acetyltransferase